jgi:RNA polymerase sigma-70 factor (ECF subfamily)
MTQQGSGPDRSTAGAPQVDWHAALAEHDRWLRTVVYARLREWGAVEDVMQEVALAALRQAAPLADATKVAPWLCRLAIRQALMYRRKLGRRRKLIAQYTSRCRPAGYDERTPDPLAWLLADERRRLVREALDRLRDRDAEILLLKYTENWSYYQIAAHLGIGHSAVEARLHRAREHLRAELAAVELAEANA